MFFVIGRDSLLDFPRWHDPRPLQSLPHWSWLTGTAPESFQSPSHLPASSAALLAANARVDINSTDIRIRVREGSSIRYRVPMALPLTSRARAVRAK